MPNIGYLGRGYDHMIGNPHPTGLEDPGYRVEIFDLSKYCGELTADQRYRIPQKISVRSVESCTLSFKTTFIESMHDYSTSLLSKFNFEADGKFEASKWFNSSSSFSASNEFKQVDQSINTKKEYVSETYAECSTYSADIHKHDPPAFANSFANAIKRLPLSNNYLYDEIIKEYGTFYIKETVMGALYGERVTITKQGMEAFQKTGESFQKAFEASAKASFTSWGTESSIGTNGMTKKESDLADKFSDYVKSKVVFTIGSKPPISSDAFEWANQAIQNPMPITARLEPIYNLLTKDHFPYDGDIEVKQQLLFQEIANYCKKMREKGQVKSCDSFENLESEKLEELYQDKKRLCAKLYWGTHQTGEPFVITVEQHNTYTENPNMEPAWDNAIHSYRVFTNCELELYPGKNFTGIISKSTGPYQNDDMKTAVVYIDPKTNERSLIYDDHQPPEGLIKAQTTLTFIGTSSYKCKCRF